MTADESIDLTEENMVRIRDAIVGRTVFGFEIDDRSGSVRFTLDDGGTIDIERCYRRRNRLLLWLGGRRG